MRSALRKGRVFDFVPSYLKNHMHDKHPNSQECARTKLRNFLLLAYVGYLEVIVHLLDGMRTKKFFSVVFLI